MERFSDRNGFLLLFLFQIKKEGFVRIMQSLFLQNMCMPSTEKWTVIVKRDII